MRRVTRSETIDESAVLLELDEFSLKRIQR